MSYDAYSNETALGGDSPCSTQDAFDKGIKDMVDDKNSSYHYSTLPTKMNLDNCIMDYKGIKSIWDKYIAHGNHHQESLDECASQCDDYINSTKSTVNHMVNQFQQKQSAHADKKTQLNKTGVLNTTTMINYRWSEDIFLKNESIADAKNHGMIMFLDWSGSMHGILKDTVDQLLILTEFCNKVGIPFEVYAFTTKQLHGINDEGYRIEGFSQYESKEDATNNLRPHSFTLLNFLSSRMKKIEYKDACRKLYATCSQASRCCPSEFGLGCTPLNEAVVSAMDIIPAFQESTGVEIVNAVFLTDGDGHGMGAYNSSSNSTSIIHDPTTKMDYKVGCDYRSETETYLEILKDRTGCNTIGIFLNASSQLNRIRYQFFNDDSMQQASIDYKKNGFVVADADKSGYDEQFIVRGSVDTSTDAFDNLDDGASYTKIRNAFQKSLGNKKSGRLIATKMIEIFASTLD